MTIPDLEKAKHGEAAQHYEDSSSNEKGIDIKKLAEKARELEENQKGMSKKVNPKVMNMIDRSDRSYLALPQP